MYDLLLTPAVRERLRDCQHHIDGMRLDRHGWGADDEILRTQRSLLDAVLFLTTVAREVWTDGADPSLSFGGVTDGGIVFGMIARTRDTAFRHDEISWTFHS
jgi:hypothetical protein